MINDSSAATPDDWDFVTRYLEGDPGAFEILFQKYKKRAYELAFHILGERAAAEDIAQEVFIKIYQKRLKPSTTAKFTTWLYRVTVNAALDVVRRRQIFFWQSLDKPLESEAGQKHFPEVVDKQPSPGESSAEKEQSEILHREIRRLPERYRLPILLYQFENLSYAEIAQILGITPKAVERRLYHARERLRETLVKKL